MEIHTDFNYMGSSIILLHIMNHLYVVNNTHNLYICWLYFWEKTPY